VTAFEAEPVPTDAAVETAQALLNGAQRALLASKEPSKNGLRIVCIREAEDALSRAAYLLAKARGAGP
jgi:hypothetical protein